MNFTKLFGSVALMMVVAGVLVQHEGHCPVHSYQYYVNTAAIPALPFRPVLNWGLMQIGPRIALIGMLVSAGLAVMKIIIGHMAQLDVGAGGRFRIGGRCSCRRYHSAGADIGRYTRRFQPSLRTRPDRDARRTFPRLHITFPPASRSRFTPSPALATSRSLPPPTRSGRYSFPSAPSCS